MMISAKYQISACFSYSLSFFISRVWRIITNRIKTPIMICNLSVIENSLSGYLDLMAVMKIASVTFIM